MTTEGLTVDGAGGLLAGRYRLRSRLGAGAMGVVWLALDERLQRPVAVKQLWPGPAQGEQARQRIMREGRIAARLRHPHVVTVHDVAEHNGQPVLVMEYVPARSLAALLAEQGPLAPEAVARIGVQAASALAAAHAAGIVHRDVKPGNLLVSDDGAVKIADFGISRATGDVALTQAGLVAGTPAYLAPEIARGQEPSPDSDVFSLGATLYAAVEGVPPFGEDENSIALLHRVAAGEVPPPRRAGPLTPVLTAVLHADPAQRPSTVQIVTALQAVADGQPVPPRALNPARARTQPVVTPSAPTVPVAPVGGGTLLNPRPTAPPNRRRFLLPVAGAVLAVLAVVVLMTQLTPDPPAPAPAPPAALDAASITAAVSEYYALLPARPDNAWARLGPRMQAQGQDAYRTFWSRITRLTITTPPAVVAANTVSVGIAYTVEDGRTITETHRLELIRSTPFPLIDADAVLSSETSTPPPPPSTPAPTTVVEQKQSDPGDEEEERKDDKPGRGHGRDRDRD
ncbi:serine/threonine-protein kinase [Amycolatopsis thermalba]|uniref:serine/threonine-protein kinase n=1 Tax=Amycolatopsis thermalba TaxID=944492 RepID=UPI0024472AA5|nr:serine/threonine-protein kinase [Amycolatopsis thermalba]